MISSRSRRHLIKEKYTSPGKLGIMGGSNGGLLVGAVEEQRPDLFAVALPAAGVIDMLRYDKFTGGHAWATEYGSSSNAEQFKYLDQVLAAPQRQGRQLLSCHLDHDCRSRRPCRAKSLVQVCRGHAGRSELRETRPDTHRNSGIAWVSANRQADRRAGRRMGVRCREHGHEGPLVPWISRAAAATGHRAAFSDVLPTIRFCIYDRPWLRWRGRRVAQHCVPPLLRDAYHRGDVVDDALTGNDVVDEQPERPLVR